MEKEIVPQQNSEAPKEWDLSWEVRSIKEQKITAEPYNKEFSNTETEIMLRKLDVQKIKTIRTGNTEKNYYESGDKSMFIVTLAKEDSNESRIVIFKDPDQIRGIKNSIEREKAA